MAQKKSSINVCSLFPMQTLSIKLNMLLPLCNCITYILPYWREAHSEESMRLEKSLLRPSSATLLTLHFEQII